ncbi:MAG TPA: pyridoxal-phosphate dependent enzyme, partial [Rectinema sp.]|nr:pyridoxal-phosphate dependent enzyme [Rectinema sp.]
RVQILQYGAELIEVDGTYDLAFEESLEYSRSSGMLSRNTGYNPLTIEGKKTASFEIAKDLAKAEDSARKQGINTNLSQDDELQVSGFPAYLAPDHVFVPTGDGVILSGIIRGFEDLLRLGWINRMPIVWAAQAEGSSAIARALATGSFEARPSHTIADSIAVDVPRNGYFTLYKLKKHGGRAVVVSDEEILKAQTYVARLSGLFAEPSSACAFAGFMKVRSELDPKARIVVMLTGNGLKDITSAAKAVGLRT